MTPTIFDIETNGIKDFRFLTDLKKIHCLITRHKNDVKIWTGSCITDGLAFLALQDVIVGHNSISFDIPAIKKLYPKWEPKGCIRDSLVMARLAWSDQKERDYRNADLPKNLIGSHSLKAWGYRLGEHKGDYSGGWDDLNDDMIKYCEQDTLVTQRLYLAASKQLGECKATALEHSFHEILCQQERNGFAFDTKAAVELYATLSGLRADLKSQLSKVYPAQTERMKMPQYWVAEDRRFKTKGEAKKAGFRDKQIKRGPNRTKVVPFNPDSRLQISQVLMEHHDWEPTVFTPNGQPQVDETVLKSLEIPEADLLVRYLTLSKRIGQLAEGKEAWLKVEDNGKIHGRINSNGAITGRCTHSRPNLSATPASTAIWGKDCRSLFTASSGKMLVGVDASGLELRCLAHYLSRWDNGEYSKLIVESDIHEVNRQAAGLSSREAAKTLIYALIYGAGPQKIGSIVNGGIREGKRLTERFLQRIPALRTLKDAVTEAANKRGKITGLDGRSITIRSAHSALNTLLQSCGAILMKQATVNARSAFRTSELEVFQVAHIHDEIQFECSPEYSEEVGEKAVEAIRQAGRSFNLKCPLDGEHKAGKTWADTH